MNRIKKSETDIILLEYREDKQKETVQSIVHDAHTDHCLAVKVNQSNAYKDLCDYFSDEGLLKTLEKESLPEPHSHIDKSVIPGIIFIEKLYVIIVKFSTEETIWKSNGICI